MIAEMLRVLGRPQQPKILIRICQTSLIKKILLTGQAYFHRLDELMLRQERISLNQVAPIIESNI